MRRWIAYICLVTIVSSCSNPKYEITFDEFKSNRALWGLSIAELIVDSINANGIPESYRIVEKFAAGQKGDHESDEMLKKDAQSAGLKWKGKKYGYLWKPQKVIPFNRINKYYNWRGDNYQEYDTLPLNFVKNKWYLLTQWQDASTGGGTYNLFVYFNDQMEFEKYFDIHAGSW